MQMRGRTLKFTAVSALVVLTLTGFSTGRHGSRHSSGGSGGGCSNSGQDHDSSSSSSTSGGSYGSGSDDDSYDDSYGSSSSSSTSGGSTYNRRPNYRSTPRSSSSGNDEDPLDGKARLVSCATAKRPYATVEVTNPNDGKARFAVWVEFDNEKGELADSNNAKVTVPANGKKQVRVQVDTSGPVDDGLLSVIDHCKVDPEAVPED
jgi:hypothetical protein